MDKAEAMKVADRIDRDAAVKIASDLINIPSQPGHERQLGEYIEHYFSSLGLKAHRQELGGDRVNTIGVLKGTGDGKSLIFNGHMDTSFSGLAEDLLWLRQEDAQLPEFRPEAKVEGDAIYGAGIANMKAGLAAMLASAMALAKSEVHLGGDVIYAAVAGETSRSPVDEFSGQEVEGGGYGTRYSVARGVVADYAICCDGSNLKLSEVQAGVVFLKITTFGRSVYVPYVERDERGRQPINALSQMIPVLTALEDWAARYEKESKGQYEGYEVAPKVCVGSIRAGAPFRPSLTPSSCSIYVDIRTRPDVSPLDIRKEVEGVLKGTGVRTELDMFRSQVGHVARGAGPLISKISQSYKTLTGKELEKASAAHNSMWTDTNVYNEIGIPCVKIGPSPPSVGTEKGYGRMPIADIVLAAKLYAVVACDVCGT